MEFQQVGIFLVQLGMNMSFLLLAAAGLAVIFGMMNIINLAHGDLIMVGAYGTAGAYAAGMPLVVAMAAGIMASVIVGMLLEIVFVRRLYRRPFDAMVVTWAVGLTLNQATLIFIGPSMPGVPIPLGKIDIGAYTFSVYQILLLPISLVVIGLLYLLFKYSRWGIEARAAMQDPETSRSLGIDVGRVYSLTFALGAALAGLAGALWAPVTVIVFSMGSAFVVQAFSTVIVGGANIFFGTTPASFLLAIVQTFLTQIGGTLAGTIGLLATVIITVRVLPRGLSSVLTRSRR